jgi:hypothetical protein
MKQIIDCTTGEIIERELNAEELQQAEVDAEASEALKALSAEKETAKQAVLEKLGLTSDEVASLLA